MLLKSRQPGLSSFFVQVALVFLPVILLAGIGFWLLAQDRSIVRHEALQIAEDLSRRAAAEIATNVASFIKLKIEERVSLAANSNSQSVPFPTLLWLSQSTNDLLLLGTISGTEVTAPPPSLSIDSEPGTASSISASRFYQQAQIAEFQKLDLDLAADLYDQAAKESVEGPLKCLALYGAGCAMAALGHFGTAAERFQAVTQVEGSLEHMTQLAQFRLITLPGGAQFSDLIPKLLNRIVTKPTSLSSELIAQLNGLVNTNESYHWAAAEIALADFVLNQNVRARKLGQRILETTDKQEFKSLFWPESEGPGYCVLRWPAENGAIIFCGIPDSLLATRLHRFANGLKSVRVPSYFSVDARWPYEIRTNSRDGSAPAVEMAAANSLAQVQSPRGNSMCAIPFVTSVSLINAPAYYHVQDTRRNLFYLVILCASVVSAFGFVIMRAGIHRLERINELKSNFVASVSHEFRAPVASVRLLAENLERKTTADPIRQQEYFRLIVQECDRLGNLIENLLSFSRQERGHTRSIEFTPVNLSALVTQAVAIMQPIAQKRGIMIATKVDSGDVPSTDLGSSILEPKHLERASRNVDKTSSQSKTLLGDSRALTQVLLNLLDNALKFSAPQSVVEVFGSNIRVREVDCVAISIRDSGPGIDHREFQQIFEPFYRVGSEMTRETAGVGIGLSLVKQILADHNGGIYLRSLPGQGSTFTILFPIVTEESNN